MNIRKSIYTLTDQQLADFKGTGSILTGCARASNGAGRRTTRRNWTAWADGPGGVRRTARPTVKCSVSRD